MSDHGVQPVGGGGSGPVFIVGCPRSGTTLASRILDAHPRLAVYLESNYYVTFRPLLRLYGDLEVRGNRRRFIADVVSKVRNQRVEPPRIDDVERDLVAPTFEGVLATLLLLHARAQGKARGADKTPWHFKYVEEIATGFPGSPPVLFLVRDPRDVVVSMRRAWNMTLEQCTQVWNEAYLALNRAPASTAHIVRYEELVRDPVTSTQDMCAVIGEAFHPVMLESTGQPPAALRGIRHLDLKMLSGPVVPSSVGNYEVLPPGEVRLIEEACGMGMEALGYAFASRPCPRVRAPVIQRDGPVRTSVQRLRYYGLNRERWRRGQFDWRLRLRVYLRSLLRPNRSSRDVRG